MKTTSDKDWVAEMARIMDRLRAPDGCPWDREQNHHTLRPYLIEEAYELIDAIEAQDDDGMTDELGDVLLQVLFHCQIAGEEGRFDLQDVARCACEKLTRRHPHVFGDRQVDDAEGVLRQWEEIKQEEKAGSQPPSALDAAPRHLPALMQAQKVQRRAAKLGFDWPDGSGPLAKIKEEIAELEAAVGAGETDAVHEEIGDLLFSLVNLSRFHDADPEELLRGCIAKFRRRFRHVESRVGEDGRTFAELSLEELDRSWDEAKALERKPTS